MNIGRTALLATSFVLVLLVGLAGGAVYTYFFSTRISKSPLVKNEAKLKQYLGLNEFFPKLLKYKTDNGQYLKVSSIIFLPYNEWKETDNCIGTRGSERIFCFDESLHNGQITITVYPNLNQIFQTDPEIVNRSLNFNLLTILETRFGISQNKGRLIMDADGKGEVFKW